MAQWKEQKQKSQQTAAYGPKQVMVNTFVRVVIESAASIGVLLFVRKFATSNLGYKRIDFVPGQNGRLLAEEYRIENGMERRVHVRYATQEEVWKYSQRLMHERLNEMKIKFKK